MKIKYIIGIVLIAICIGVIMSAYGDSSTYVDFHEASLNPGKEFHVVGELNKEKEMVYDPAVDPNYFSFYMRDTLGAERKVIYNNPKPQDFERSEKIVLVGKISGEEFHASGILLKCPSKYNDAKLDVAHQE